MLSAVLKGYVLLEISKENMPLQVSKDYVPLEVKRIGAIRLVGWLFWV